MRMDNHKDREQQQHLTALFGVKETPLPVQPLSEVPTNAVNKLVRDGLSKGKIESMRQYAEQRKQQKPHIKPHELERELERKYNVKTK